MKLGLGLGFTKDVLAGVLDRFTGASGAYSTNKLSYKTDAVLRLRRGTDNGETNVTASGAAGSVLNYVVPTGIQELYNNVRHLNGTDQSITVPHNSIFNRESDEVTIFRGWFYQHVVPTATTCFVDKRAATSNGFMFGLGANGVPSFRMNNTQTIGTGNYADGNIHTVRFEQAPSYTRFYFDDVLVASAGGFAVNTDANMVFGAKSVGSSAFEEVHGLLYGFEYEKNGVVLAAWDNLTWEDTIGDNDGTLNNSPPVFTGQDFFGKTPIWYDQRVSTSRDVMNFDGVGNYVSVAGMTASTNYFGACTITARVFVRSLSALKTVWALGASAYRLLMNDGTWRLNSSTNTGVAVTAGQQIVSVTYNSAGAAVSFRINGATVWTGTAAISGTSPTDTFYIGARDFSGIGLFWDGGIWDFSLTGSSVKNFSFAGDGNINENWLDTVGSNNGTVSGSPDRLSTIDYTTISNDTVQTTTTQQPALITNGQRNTINGRPALRFNATDSTFLSCPNTELMPTTALTIFVVLQNDAATLADNEHVASIYDTNNQRCFAVAVRNDDYLMQYGDMNDGTFEGNWQTTAGYDMSVPRILTIRYDGSLAASSRIKIYLNGAGVASAREISGSQNPPASLFQSNAPFAIGCAFATAPSTIVHFNGLIGTVVPFTTAMTDDEIAAFSANLNRYWRVY